MKKINLYIILFFLTAILVVAFLHCFSSELKQILIIFCILSIGFIVALNYLERNNDRQQRIILIGGIGVTIFSWFVTGYLNNKNEKIKSQLSLDQSVEQSRRDLKIKILLDAYFRLLNANNRDTVPPGQQHNDYDYIYLKYSESALTAVGLLAGDSTVKLSNEYILSGGKHYSELLVMLRNELRNELKLSRLPTTKEYDPTTFRSFRRIGAPGQLTPQQQLDLTIKLNEFHRELLK